jgi:hypothetical protein
VAAAGLSERVHVCCADWTGLDLTVQAAFVDPSRRLAGRRVFGLRAMDPPIERIAELVGRVPDVAVKVGPGVAHETVPRRAEIEFISEQGRLKEALLRFGGLRLGRARTATLLPGPHQMVGPLVRSEPRLSPPSVVLYEPDPAVIRAGLVQDLAAQLGAAQLDPHIAYLTGDTPAASPFARSWTVLRHGPFHLKTLNRWLRELGAGVVVVKKRGSAIEPDAFRRRLATVKKGRQVTVFLTRVSDRPWMIVCGEAHRAGHASFA